jgi:hypothetical protein
LSHLKGSTVAPWKNANENKDECSSRKGSGYFPYPASSFMIGQTRWIYYGAGIAIVGLLLIVIARP